MQGFWRRHLGLGWQADGGDAEGVGGSGVSKLFEVNTTRRVGKRIRAPGTNHYVHRFAPAHSSVNR
jgi:hypothetical protein